MINTDRPTENMQIEKDTIGKPKRGPPVSTVCSYSFHNPTAYSKHCKQSVRHHHKAAYVKTRLRKCSQLKKVMLDMTVTDRPDWRTDQKGTAKSKFMSFKSSSSECSKSQSLVRSFTVPLFSASEQKRFNHEMATYFYCTGTSFQRAENPFLLRAIQLARPDAKLPTRKQLADDGPRGLLSECYQKVKGEVNKVFSNLFASQVMHGRMLGMLSTTWLYLQLNHFSCKR